MSGAQWALVFAALGDAEARAFVEARAESGVLLATPRDLSREGWMFDPQAPEDARLRVGDRLLSPREISGALVRLIQVDPGELSWIAAQDRAYVAAEMSAFLLAFLTLLPVPAFNRPTSQALAGPFWPPERWRRLARGLGRPAARAPRAVVPGGPPPRTVEAAIRVHVVGPSYFGPPELRAGARALAQAAGAALLRLDFDGDGALLGAEPSIDLANPAVAEAAFALIAPPEAGRAT